MSAWLRVLTISFLFVGCSAAPPEGTQTGDCSDGEDNDGDGQFDCADDGCSMFTSCIEKNKPKSGLLSSQVKAAAQKKAEE